ncbi:MAG: choice-of-anchor tandem repeat NxxGxxAF-containing protein [Planctomycetota bacterium]
MPDALYRQRPDGSLELLAVAGDPAPGLPAGTTFSSTLWGVTNAAGATAFRATIDGPAVTSPVDNGLWLRAPDGTTDLIVASGVQAPLLPDGVQVDSLGDFALLPDGALIVGAKLRGYGVAFPQNSVLYAREPSGEFSLLAVGGDDIPGTSGAMQYGSVQFMLERAMDDGRLLVIVSRSDFGDRLLGVLSADGSSLDVLVSENSAHPDLAEDERIGPFLSGRTRASEAGVVAFGTNLQGADIPPTERIAVFAGHIDTGIALLARVGTQVQVAPGDVRTVGESVPGTISAAAAYGLSESGPIGVSLRFEDGSRLIAEFDPRPCLADVNGDGFLNPADFSAWVIALNTQAPECDQNGDGLCNPADFGGWIINFNAGC